MQKPLVQNVFKMMRNIHLASSASVRTLMSIRGEMKSLNFIINLTPVFNRRHHGELRSSDS